MLTASKNSFLSSYWSVSENQKTFCFHTTPFVAETDMMPASPPSGMKDLVPQLSAPPRNCSSSCFFLRSCFSGAVYIPVTDWFGVKMLNFLTAMGKKSERPPQLQSSPKGHMRSWLRPHHCPALSSAQVGVLFLPFQEYGTQVYTLVNILHKLISVLGAVSGEPKKASIMSNL